MSDNTQPDPGARIRRRTCPASSPLQRERTFVEWLIAGKVAIAIGGDAMTPRFPDGQVVGFEVLAPGSLPPIGDDCLIVRRETAGNEIIFRRVADVDTNGVVTLAAINATKYPEQLTVRTGEIVLVAVARWLGTPLQNRRADA